MGKIVISAITIASFIFGISAGGFGVGLLFALFMGGMAWTAFGWKNKPNIEINGVDYPKPVLNQQHLNLDTPHMPVFEFAEGIKLSPKEYGYCSGRWSFDSGLIMLEDFWGTARPEAVLPGADSIRANQFFAHLYMTSLNIGSYLMFAQHVLHANQSIMNDIILGVSDFLENIKGSNGKSLENADKDLLLNLILRFKNAIISDFNDAQADDPRSCKPMGVNMQSSKLLLVMLDCLCLGPPNNSRPFLFDGIESLKYMLGGSLLDDQAMTLITILSNHHKVRLNNQC